MFAVVVGGVNIATIEVKVVRVVGAVGSAGPIETVGADVVERSAISIHVAGSWEEGPARSS